MFENVLIPYDFSSDSRYALECIRQIPGVRQIFLTHIVYDRLHSKDSAPDPLVDYARLRLEDVKKGLEPGEARIVTIAEEISAGSISDAINRVAQREGISLIAMGRRGRGIIETLLLGSVASDILHYGTTDLLLVHSPESPGREEPGSAAGLFSKVLICTDFSEPEIAMISLQKLPWLQAVHCIHVVTSGISEKEIQSRIESAQARLATIKDEISRRQITAEVSIRVGSAEEEILALARQEEVSLILMKSTGRRGLRTDLLGSKTSYVSRKTEKPILVLRRSAKNR